MIGGDKILVPKYCETILDEELVTELEEDHYDIAIIDLMFNECGLALAHRLNLPVVGKLLCQIMLRQELFSQHAVSLSCLIYQSILH